MLLIFLQWIPLIGIFKIYTLSYPGKVEQFFLAIWFKFKHVTEVSYVYMYIYYIRCDRIFVYCFNNIISISLSVYYGYVGSVFMNDNNSNSNNYHIGEAGNNNGNTQPPAPQNDNPLLALSKNTQSSSQNNQSYDNFDELKYSFEDLPNDDPRRYAYSSIGTEYQQRFTHLKSNQDWTQGVWYKKWVEESAEAREVAKQSSYLGKSLDNQLKPTLEFSKNRSEIATSLDKYKQGILYVFNHSSDKYRAKRVFNTRMDNYTRLSNNFEGIYAFIPE